MSTLSPNPAEEPGDPPSANSGQPGIPAAKEPIDAAAATDVIGAPATEDPAVTPAAEAAIVTPATPDPAVASVANEGAGTPPTAEILVTPAAEESADIADAAEPAGVPAGEHPAGEHPAGAEPAGAEPAWAALLRKPAVGQAIVMVTGVLLFIWGFLPWYSDAGGSANAWSTATIPGLLLTATWVPLLSLALVVFVAIKVFVDGFPDKLLGFSWPQLSMVVGVFDVLITLGYLVANRRLGNLGSLNLGIGLILSFITALVLLGGAILDHIGAGADTFRRLRPPNVRRPG
jgi:hypothetical protein